MVMQNNVPIGRMEFVDPKSIYVINNYSGSINVEGSIKVEFRVFCEFQTRFVKLETE